jgi:heme oxygenase
MDSTTRLQAANEAGDALPPRLKRDTRASHMALESRIDLLNRVKTVADYRKVLEVFYGLFAPIEARIGQHKAGLAAWLPDIEHRFRIDALRNDLQVLGSIALEDLPIAAIPEYTSLGGQMGCMYVLEGSTLGGQVISRHIHQTLGFTPEHGCGFFDGYGATTGEMWQRFRIGIESYASARPSEHTAVIESAIRTFQIFDAWMNARL